MAHTITNGSKTTPRDFFLWAGAVIALYGSVISLITLLFEYVNRLFPDPLAYYGDPFGGAVRAAMAGVIVLVPTTIFLFRIIRTTIAREEGKAEIWVRRWALVLTVFIAVVVILVDLITLITTFLGGEITIRFALKAAGVLAIAAGVFGYFTADLKGYWGRNPRRAQFAGAAAGVIAIAAIVGGFFIIGSPSEIRMLRYDDQKVNDLQSIQHQVVTFYQQKGTLPQDLSELNDPLAYFVVPVDTQTQQPYGYTVTGPLSFELCATFNRAADDMSGKGSYPGYDRGYMPIESNESWMYAAGETCFTRSIDPERYPVFDRTTR